MAISGGSALLIIFIHAVSILTSAAEPPSLTLEDNQHIDRIIEAMIGAGDFRDWAGDFLSAINDQFGVPLSATIFIPDEFDATAVSVTGRSGGVGGGGGHVAVAYHIVPRRFSYSDLLLMAPLTRLPTLLPGTSIVITNNSASNFAIDGVAVSSPDLFLSSSIVIHGLASPLDVSLYSSEGGGGDGTLAGSPLPRTRKVRANSASTTSPARLLTWLFFPTVVAVVSVVSTINTLL